MKLGIIGFGKRLRHVVNECLREAEPELRVVAAIDPNEEGVRVALPEAEGQGLVFCATIEEMVERCGIDAVAIGTRCNLHARYAIEAAQAGLPIYLEKPVATTLEDAIALEEAFIKSGTAAVVSFPLRVSPLCQRVGEVLHSGRFGATRHVMAFNYVPYGNVYFDSWYRDYSVTGGLLLQKATHDLDYLAWCMGSPIVRVAATLSCGEVFRDASLAAAQGHDPDARYYEQIGTPQSGMNEDSSNILLEFANGSRGLYTQVFYARKAAAARGARFSACNGTVEFDWCQNQAKVFDHFKPFEETIRVDANLSHHGGDGELARNFIDLVRGKSVAGAGIAEGLQSVYACLAAKQSAHTGEFCAVRQVSDALRANR